MEVVDQTIKSTAMQQIQNLIQKRLATSILMHFKVHYEWWEVGTSSHFRTKRGGMQYSAIQISNVPQNRLEIRSKQAGPWNAGSVSVI